MSIKIKIEKIKAYRFDTVEMLNKNSLPVEYLNGFPNMYINKKGEIVLNNVSIPEKLHIHHVSCIIDGDCLYTQAEYDEIVKHIEAAGNRLYHINHKNDKKEEPKQNEKPVEDWSGTYTFEV